jgi:thioredoxin 1
MALETCFRAWALHAAAPAKDRLLAGGGSTSFAPSKRTAAAAPLSVGRVATPRRPRHVCQSKNAVDEGAWRLGFSSSKYTYSDGGNGYGNGCIRVHGVCAAGPPAVLVADDANWDGMVIACEAPVLVEFWAPWCGPCRMIAPVIDELAKEYAGKIKCCKVNTDDNPKVASTYGIRSIPTVLIFKAGEKKESVIGAVPKTTLTTLIDKYIGS